jgi:hypothetical protein
VLQPPVAPVPAKPEPLPALGPNSEPLAVVGKYAVLKDDKLIEGAVSVSGDTVFVRQGALDRPFHKTQVQFVAANRDEVYKFMLAKVPAADAPARLQVARWCMFNGMREQALFEAHEVQKVSAEEQKRQTIKLHEPALDTEQKKKLTQEVQKLQTVNRVATDLIRSLELSLQHFPSDSGPLKMVAPTEPTFPAELSAGPMPMPVPSAPPEPRTTPAPPIPPAVDPEPDVTPEAALVFGSRVQPFLANQCFECHAQPDYAGKFKLVRVNPTEAGPQATRTNLRAVAGQLKKDDPAASPLLMKALSVHGGMKRPAIETRQAAVYRALEEWAVLAVGAPVTAPVAQPVQPVPAPVTTPLPLPQPPTDPILPPPAPPGPGPLPPPPVDPLLPRPEPQGGPVPVPPSPGLPFPAPPVPQGGPAPLPTPPAPVPVPVPPAVPGFPLVPPQVEVLPPVPPVVPPAPAPLPKPVPTTPPFVSPVDAGTKPSVPVPTIPPIPPATAAPAPAPVVPVGGQFGTTMPPKPPVTGPMGGDEFDPAGFNQQPRK